MEHYYRSRHGNQIAYKTVSVPVIKSFPISCFWHLFGIGLKKNNPMKENITIMVVEDNVYYNKLLTSALSKKLKALSRFLNFPYEIQSFVDAGEWIQKIKSNTLNKADSILFVDYYLGDGINGSHIIKLLREQPFNSTVVLLSKSKNAPQKTSAGYYDFFILKDESALPLCCLCLEQFIDNKFFVHLNKGKNK
jgi:CheY-like chemotaxis protein